MSEAVVHLVPRLVGGPIGAIAALLDGGGPTGPGGQPLRHELISLAPAAPTAVARLERIGVAVSEAGAGDAELGRRLADAAIVHLHHWSSPDLGELLGLDLEPMRLACWTHVNGIAPPQRTPLWLVERAAAMVAVTAVTEAALRKRGVTRPIDLIEPGIDPELAARIDRIAPASSARDEAPPVAGYVGSLDSAKVHPRIAGLIAAAIEGTGARAELCGSGDAAAAIERDIARLGIADRLHAAGHEDDVPSRLARFDVFAYPLAEGTYAAAELAVREAMRAGLPVVAIDRGGLGAIVEDGVTGILAPDEATFVEAVRWLLGEPAERRRLGAAARRAELGRRPSAEAWTEVYARILSEPKAAWVPPSEPLTGAAGLVAAIGGEPVSFGASLGAEPADADADAREADAAVAVAGPVIARSDGGVLDNRRHAPGDRHLRLWSGLMLADQGHPAMAAAELAAASRLGLGERVAPALDLAQRRTRDGLGWIGTGPIAYLGTSLTVQRVGYRTALQRLLAEALPGLGRDLNAGVPELGSLGAAFLMDQLVLVHRPSACFLEVAYMDVARATAPELVEPAIEGIVRRLRAHGCEPCFLYIDSGDPERMRHPPALASHRLVAGRLGVREVDLSNDLGPADRSVDSVHLTKEGGRRAAKMIFDRLRAMPAPAAADSVLGHERARELGLPRLVPVRRSDLRDPDAGTNGRYRLLMPYVAARPGNPFRPPLDGGDIWGAVITIGPTSAAALVRGTTRNGGGEERRPLWTPWATYERFGVVVFSRPRHADGGFELEADVDGSNPMPPGDGPAGDGNGQDLRVISWMVTG